MRHVWLPSLGAWAQVQEPSVAASQTFESRADSSAVAVSCSHGQCSSTESPRKRSARPRHDPHHSSFGHHHLHHNSRHNDVHGDGRYEHVSCHHSPCTARDPHQHGHHCVNVRDPHHKASDELDQHEHHHDWRNGSYNHDKHRDHHHEPHYTCPICLSSISQSSVTVLRWCMHRFCITCIEKWSCMQRFCPLCKQIFHGWYYNIKSSLVFDKKDLAAESSLQRRERYPVSRRPTYLSVRRSQPLPWRRDFRFPRRATLAHFEKVPESKADEEALRWRTSVYRKNLRAVPPHVNSRVKIKQAPANDPERKARIERRLEPWIHRELQAIMEDTDPSLLVQFVLSLWLHALAEKEKIVERRNSEQRHEEVLHTGIWDSEAIRQLEPFLQEKASIFWHELRCFAESPFSLQTYDCVTKYEKFRG